MSHWTKAWPGLGRWGGQPAGKAHQPENMELEQGHSKIIYFEHPHPKAVIAQEV